jgi:hypothetical protein
LIATIDFPVPGAPLIIIVLRTLSLDDLLTQSKIVETEIACSSSYVQKSFPFKALCNKCLNSVDGQVNEASMLYKSP